MIVVDSAIISQISYRVQVAILVQSILCHLKATETQIQTLAYSVPNGTSGKTIGLRVVVITTSDQSRDESTSISVEYELVVRVISIQNNIIHSI